MSQQRYDVSFRRSLDYFSKRLSFSEIDIGLSRRQVIVSKHLLPWQVPITNDNELFKAGC